MMSTTTVIQYATSTTGPYPRLTHDPPPPAGNFISQLRSPDLPPPYFETPLVKKEEDEEPFSLPRPYSYSPPGFESKAESTMMFPTVLDKSSLDAVGYGQADICSRIREMIEQRKYENLTEVSLADNVLLPHDTCLSQRMRIDHTTVRYKIPPALRLCGRFPRQAQWIPRTYTLGTSSVPTTPSTSP